MNHISRLFAAPDKKEYASHAWELRDGGFRRVALLLGYPFWPIESETRLIRFLMDRGFRVHALEIGFGASASERSKSCLKSLRVAASAYAADIAGSSGLPLYVFASSFSTAFAPAFLGHPGLAAVALIAPVLDFSPLGSMPPRFFKPYAEIAVGIDALSGMPELVKPLFKAESFTIGIQKRDYKALCEEPVFAKEGPLGVPVAAFIGEADPLSNPAQRDALAAGGVKIYSYPRVRHAPAYDRYADNYFADLGSFVDEVESARARRKKT